MDPECVRFVLSLSIFIIAVCSPFSFRYRKLADDGMQQIGAFNGNRHWTRPMVEFLDHDDPLEVYKFVEQYPQGKDTWKKKRKRKSKYIRKKEKKVP